MSILFRHVSSDLGSRISARLGGPEGLKGLGIGCSGTLLPGVGFATAAELSWK